MIKKFKLGEVNWKVKVDNQRMDDKSAYGISDYTNSEIILDDKNKELMDETLWHEVIHAILRSIGEDKLNKDERFVQSMAVLLNQYDKTRK